MPSFCRRMCLPTCRSKPELAVVIGKRAKHVQAPLKRCGCVFGYTICNDVSARGWQFQDRTFWRSKNSGTFKPLGPWIQRGVDLASLVTRVGVNGEVARDLSHQQHDPFDHRTTSPP